MSVNAIGKQLAAANAALHSRRDGIPQQAQDATPMEPLGKDHFAASGNTVGKATEGSVDGIMKFVKSPEVAVAAVATAAGAIGGAAVGFLAARGSGAVQGAKLGAALFGGAGLAGAGVTLAADKNMNTYAKTIVAPILVATGAGITIGALHGSVGGYNPTVALGMAGALKGARIGAMIGAGGSTLATAFNGVVDILETFKARF